MMMMSLSLTCVVLQTARSRFSMPMASKVAMSMCTSLASMKLASQNQALSRYFSTRRKVDIKNVAQLRRTTGYGLSLCREALAATNNEMDSASEWLSEQALVRGLQKAEKLQERKAGEGLVGVLIEDNHAAMVEVCCETDFVSQNDLFVQLVAKTATTALGHRKAVVQQALDLGGSLTHLREVLLTHKLNDMTMPHSNETIDNAILQLVGRLGERIKLRRAITMTTDTSSILGRYTHGPFTFEVDECSMGKYAAVVAIQPTGITSRSCESLQALAARLAQHIVGMGPSFISLDDVKGEDVNHSGNVLLEQQYLMDDSITVGELLHKHDAKVVDFIRLVCGEE